MIIGDEPIPGYRLQELLGRGGLGEVWRAVGPGGAPLALKFVDLSSRQARREWQTLQCIRDIRHPHLLPCTAMWLLDRKGRVIEGPTDVERPSPPQSPSPFSKAIDSTDRDRRPATLAVAMLLGDKCVYDRLEECRSGGAVGIPVGELLRYMEDAARGLDFLNSPRHDLGAGPAALQHCDVKPQNMLIVGDAVMICDFGLATVLGARSSRSQVLGSPAYMAPECAAGKPPSRTTDQYSLAIAYYELRTGRLPFTDESTAAVLNAHINGNLHFDDVEFAERAAVRRATSLDPAARFDSSLAFVAALRQAIQNDQTGARSGWHRSGLPSAPTNVPTAAPVHFSPPREPLRETVAAAAPPSVGRPPAPESPERRSSPKMPPALAEALHAFASSRAPHHEPSPSSPSAPPEPVPPPRPKAEKIPRRAREYYERGMQHLARSELAAAIENFTLAIGAHGAFAEAFNRRGLALRKAGKYSAALADCHRALQLNPASATTYRNRGQAYFRRRRYKQALADFSAAILMNAHDARSFLRRGQVYEALGDLTAAIADYAASLRLRPDNYVARMQRGAALELAGDGVRAIDDYSAAIALKPDDVLPLAFRAAIQARTGRLAEALADYTRCLELQPEFGFFKRRGEVYARMRRHDLAVRDFSAALALRPQSAKVLKLRGLARQELGDAIAARVDFVAAERLEAAAQGAWRQP